MFSLAAAHKGMGCPVISSTSTRILKPQSKQSEELILKEDNPEGFLQRITEGLEQSGHLTVARALLPGDKLKGLDCQELEAIADHCPTALILIEADGARRCSLKAPGPNEPVVPGRSDALLAVLGLDCIGKPLDTDHVFRAELVARCTDQILGSVITPQTLARLIGHPQGLLKGCPSEARSVVILNKTDIAGGMDMGRAVFAAAQECGGTQPDKWIAASVLDGVYERGRCSFKIS
jgi:probable selenium-dependent hydroxylase accessory protein YqeC